MHQIQTSRQLYFQSYLYTQEQYRNRVNATQSECECYIKALCTACIEDTGIMITQVRGLASLANKKIAQHVTHELSLCSFHLHFGQIKILPKHKTHKIRFGARVLQIR